MAFFQYPCLFVFCVAASSVHEFFRAPVANTAKVAELVDALDLGSSGVTRESSSLSFRTSIEIVGNKTGLTRQYPGMPFQEQVCKFR